MFTKGKVTEICYMADEFCKFYDRMLDRYTLKRFVMKRENCLIFMITPGDIDDRKPLECKSFIEFIYGKLIGDKGYISKNLFQKLFVDGIQLITKLKSNMKGSLMSISNRILLRKRAIIEQ